MYFTQHITSDYYPAEAAKPWLTVEARKVGKKRQSVVCNWSEGLESCILLVKFVFFLLEVDLMHRTALAVIFRCNVEPYYFFP